MFPLRTVLFLLLVSLLLTGRQAGAGEWPTYRHDSRRSGTTQEALEPPLLLEWVFKPQHAPQPAWPLPGEELPRMHADSAYHVTTSGGIACFGSSVDNTVLAVEMDSGKVLWTFCTHGPVRFAPSFHEGRVYLGSDDGFVYCLDRDTGSLVWKHRAGPGPEMAIGNGRIISVWPVRTSVLVDGDQVFFGAGVFPFEGICIGALRAGDGSVIWKNDTVGDRAHELEYGGISPQGYLLATSDLLFVPSGRAMPAAFDRHTGKFLYYASPGGKRGGTWALLEDSKLVTGIDLSGKPHKVAFDARSGKGRSVAYAWFPGLDMVVAEGFTYILTREGIRAVDRAAHAAALQSESRYAGERNKLKDQLARIRKEKKSLGAKDGAAINARIEELTVQVIDIDGKIRAARDSSTIWKHVRPGLTALAGAAGTIVTGGDGFVEVLDGTSGKPLWEAKVEGRACAFALSNGRLLVSTDKGPVYCFGKTGSGSPVTIETVEDPNPFPDDSLSPVYAGAAERYIGESGIRKGFCLVLDCGEGRLAFELARRSKLKVVGLEKDPIKLQSAREKLRRAGLLGSRVVVEPWEIENLPPWFANLVVSDAMVATGKMVLPEGWSERVLRPCGGTMFTCSPVGTGDGPFEMSVRGPLDGAGSWTQLYGNPANTACSGDRLVKGPFGVLWYGEPGSRDIVDRHGRACGPVSIDGRLFHQGGEVVMACDAYNGTMLWKRNLPGAVRVRVDVDGGNLALTGDGLYVVAYDRCHRLDPATGETVRVFDLPPQPDGRPGRWGFVAAEGKILFGSVADPLAMPYGAIWKDFVNSDENCWKSEEEIADDVWQAWEKSGRYRDVIKGSKARFPEPDDDLFMDYQRAGTLWQPMADFPAWDSQRTPRGALTGRLMAGDTLFAMDADTGGLLWTRRGKNIPNISISIADRTVFFVEGEPSEAERAAALQLKADVEKNGLYEAGKEASLVREEEVDIRIVVALDAATGEVRWRKPLDLTGCGGDKMGTACAEGVLLFFGHFSNHDTKFFQRNELTWRRVTAVDAATGRFLWSRPLNYLRRPLVVGDKIIIEPRACDLHTGKTMMRSHPVSGQPVPWEFLRPGHCCAVTSASAHTLFYRSYWGAIYDFTRDGGLSLFGAIRPGCWLNMISANGLMLMPEASAGCTCSFPLRCSLALAPRPEKSTDNWTVFISHGPSKPVKHMAVNLGAPGDMRDSDGRLWLSWPRPRVVSSIGYGNYAMPLDLKVELGPGAGYFKRGHRGVRIAGTERPWLFTSGCRGLVRCEIPLIDREDENGPGIFTIRLGFIALESDRPESRVFDVKINGATVLAGFDIVEAAGAAGSAVIKEFVGIRVEEKVVLEFASRQGSSVDEEAPLVNFIEIVRDDLDNLPAVARGSEGVEPGGADKIIELARAKLDGGESKEALDLFHQVFESCVSVDEKRMALDGMGRIASPDSLPVLERYWKRSASILTEYRAVEPEIISLMARLILSVADKLAGQDGSRAQAAMTSLKQILPELLDARLREEVAARLGYILVWKLLGPVPWREECASVGEVHAVGNQIDARIPLRIGGSELDWNDHTGSGLRIDLQEVFGPHDRVFAYAFADFDLETTCDLQLKIGSDDGFNCWFNGEAAGGFNAPRGWQADATTLRVRGKKGRNTILLQIIEHGGDWAFSVKVIGVDGFPLPFRRGDR